MAVSESDRYELHERLVDTLGRDAAATLMGYLPPVGWADVATKRDLDSLGHQLRAEMADTRTELKTEMAELRTELKTEMADLRTEMADFRTELRTAMADFRGELKTEMAGLRGEIGSVGSRLFFQMAGLQISAAALVVAVSQVL